MDSSPVVFITCNVSEGLLGKDSFQEVDITGIAMPITKATYLVRDPQTIPDVMRQAFAVAAHRPARPGAHRLFEKCHLPQHHDRL